MIWSRKSHGILLYVRCRYPEICLLLLQKNFGGKFSAEKVEQIIHNTLCDLLLTVVQVSSTLNNINTLSDQGTFTPVGAQGGGGGS